MLFEVLLYFVDLLKICAGLAFSVCVFLYNVHSILDFFLCTKLKRFHFFHCSRYIFPLVSNFCPLCSIANSRFVKFVWISTALRAWVSNRCFLYRLLELFVYQVKLTYAVVATVHRLYPINLFYTLI
uniref:Secreted protein n=1 Tax=Heterorhabditis bacteriophora TaxID=37862 RepID=A0A1I7W6C9_HETBA